MCLKYFQYTTQWKNNLHSTHSWSNCEFSSRALNPAHKTPRASNRGRKYTCVLRWIDLPNRSRLFCSQALNRTAHKRPVALPWNRTLVLNIIFYGFFLFVVFKNDTIIWIKRMDKNARKIAYTFRVGIKR